MMRRMKITVLAVAALCMADCSVERPRPVPPMECNSNADCPRDSYCHYGHCLYFWAPGAVSVSCGCQGGPPAADFVENDYCPSGWEVVFLCNELCPDGEYMWGMACE